MSRCGPVVLSALVTLVIAAPVAAGGRPEKIDNEPVVLGPEAFAGTCTFPVALADSFASSRTFVFPTASDGGTRVLTTGGYKSTLTNLDTGKTLDVSFFGALRMAIQPDGSAQLAVSGRQMWWFTDADEAAMWGLEPGIYFITGKVTAVVDENFVTIAPATVRGTVRDLCAELAG